MTDIPRARKFYEDVLGLEVAEEMMSGKWIEYAVGEDMLAIANGSNSWTPSDQGTGGALEVENFGHAIKRLKIDTFALPPRRSRRDVVTWPSLRTPTATNSSFTS